MTHQMDRPFSLRVVPLDRVDLMSLDHRYERLQKVQAKGITDVAQMDQPLGPSLLQEDHCRFQAIQIAVTVGKKADLLGQRVGGVQGCCTFGSHAFSLYPHGVISQNPGACRVLRQAGFRSMGWVLPPPV